jgi:hypothetical protein
MREEKIHTIRALCTQSTNAHHSDKNSTCWTFFNCNYPCCSNTTLLYFPYTLMVKHINNHNTHTSYKFTAHHMWSNKNREQDIISINLQKFPLLALTFAPVTLYCQRGTDFTISCAIFQPWVLLLVHEWVDDSHFDITVTSGLTLSYLVCHTKVLAGLWLSNTQVTMVMTKLSLWLCNNLVSMDLWSQISFPLNVNGNLVMTQLHLWRRNNLVSTDNGKILHFHKNSISAL